MPRDEQFGAERDARQVFNRMAGCWTYWGWKYGYFDSENDAQIYYDEMCAMLARQIGAPEFSRNGSIPDCIGRTAFPGRRKGTGSSIRRAAKQRRSADTFSHPQVSACYILGIEDDLVNEGGIFDGVVREARIFKGGSGSGANFSKIRAAGEKLTGRRHVERPHVVPQSFRSCRRRDQVRRHDAPRRQDGRAQRRSPRHRRVRQLESARRAQGRRSRRRLADLREAPQRNHRGRARHARAGARTARSGAQRIAAPAIREAIASGIPSGATQNALDYARQGYTRLQIEQYDTAWDSEAYVTVSGQNSNNSVRLDERFLRRARPRRRLAADGAHDRRRRQDASRPRDLWEQIALAAWQCADPGLQFDDTIQEWHTCSNDERINATNPCSEYVFIDDTACNLS